MSYFGNPAKGHLGDNLTGLAIDTSGNIWVLGRDGSSGTDVVDGVPLLFRVNPTTGARTVVSNFGAPAQGHLGVNPTDLETDASGNIWVTDAKAGMNGRGALFRIDPTTGARTVVSDFGDPTKGRLGDSLSGVTVAPAITALQPVDLTIANMEITQAIQNFANDVPLVQDKLTYVRVYPKVDIADRRVGAQLRGFRNGVELPVPDSPPGSPLKPLYPLSNVHISGANRAVLNDSFNFLVPPAWRSGTVTFQAEINPGGTIPQIPETNPNNNTFSLTNVEFTERAPICVVMVPVRTHGSLYTVDSPGFNSIIARFKSLWPVADVWVYYQSTPVSELQARFGIPPWEFGPYELPDKGWKVLGSLLLRDALTDRPAKCPLVTNAQGQRIGPNVYYVGMVSPDTDTGDVGGYATLWEAKSWVKMQSTGPAPFSTPFGGSIMAQELSHNENGIPIPGVDSTQRWRHVDCPKGKVGRTIPNYPYDTDKIGPTDPLVFNSTYWGFDPITRMLIPPNGAADYMSYCSPTWVSDYNWKGMFDELTLPNPARVQSMGTASGLADLTQSAEILVLGGAITHAANVASFEYAYRLPQGIISASKFEELRLSPPSLDGAVPAYTLELVDANGAVLFAQPFDASVGTHDEDHPEEIFLLTVPFNPTTARIRITRSGQELGALTVSAHAPQVRLLQPISGETITDRLTIRWEASDQDNDALFYTVQYSRDLGATWQSLVTQTPETTLTLDDTSSLPGSNQRSLIRVIANDGVNTASDTSAPFTVQPHVPVAHIDTPSNQDVFALNSQVILMGGARDAEDGPLGDEALTWLVNGQQRGSGKEAAVDGLAPGSYVITLKGAGQQPEQRYVDAQRRWRLHLHAEC